MPFVTWFNVNVVGTCYPGLSAIYNFLQELLWISIYNTALGAGVFVTECLSPISHPVLLSLGRQVSGVGSTVFSAI